MPAAAESSRVCAPQDVTEMARRLSDLNFLLCEDEPLIALDVEDTLHTLGAWRIATIESSAAAKEWMRGEVLPDVAILDVVLADGPCFPLAEGLLAAGVKILFVTGYAQGIPDGLKDCPIVEKPFMAEELAAAILRMVGRSSPAEAEKERKPRPRAPSRREACRRREWLPAMPPKPRTPAMMATTRKMIAQKSRFDPLMRLLHWIAHFRGTLRFASFVPGVSYPRRESAGRRRVRQRRVERMPVSTRPLHHCASGSGPDIFTGEEFAEGGEARKIVGKHLDHDQERNADDGSDDAPHPATEGERDQDRDGVEREPSCRRPAA